MNNLQNHHDLTDEQWAKIEPIIKERIGSCGGSNAGDNRVFVNACFFVEENGMISVILPKRNRKAQRWYDKDLYKVRYLVENAFLKLKRRRGVATRYAKTTSSFLGAV